MSGLLVLGMLAGPALAAEDDPHAAFYTAFREHVAASADLEEIKRLGASAKQYYIEYVRNVEWNIRHEQRYGTPQSVALLTGDLVTRMEAVARLAHIPEDVSDPLLAQLRTTIGK